ncbi:hypothetical protein [Streptomyces wuyuanensis]|uniref:hypothetical protein n=1 Tax=Streptomyces wuyuanensis TaxID=1196353 RepID=UPI0034487379
MTVVWAVAAVMAANFVWNGTPYPSADPDAVARRLKDQSDRVHDDFALPGKYTASPGRVGTGACYHRGLRGIAHIDEARSDVRSFDLDWSVPDVPEATAREAQQRVRRRLLQQGWKLTHEGDVRAQPSANWASDSRTRKATRSTCGGTTRP